MAKIKVGIVEDEMVIAEGLIQALTQLGYDTTEPAASYTEAIQMIQDEKPDILLLDIQLSGRKDGIDLAWAIREEYGIPFIFLTANADAATVERAKKVSPPAYLVKPFSKDDLYSSIEICLYNSAPHSKQQDENTDANYLIKDSLFLKQGQTFHKVRVEDILYMESQNVYVRLYTLTGNFLVRCSIPACMELINDNRFFRVHRSYAINTLQMDAINQDSVLIKGNEVPIGRTYREELLSTLRLG